MIYNRLNKLSATHKIALFFTFIVFVFVASLQILIYITTEQEWNMKKDYFMRDFMSNINSTNDVSKYIKDARVFDGNMKVLFNLGIFSSGNFEDIGHDKIIKFKDNYYYIVTEKIKDGNSVCYAQDITDFINNKNLLVRNTLIFSVISVFFIYFIGLFFARRLLSPINNIIQKALNFNYKNDFKSQEIINTGSKDDEMGLLTQTLNNLFLKVINESNKLEQFSADISHELKNKLFEFTSSLQLSQKSGYSRDIAEQLLAQVSEMSSLINSLILLAKTDNSYIERKQENILEMLNEIPETKNKKVRLNIQDRSLLVNKELFKIGLQNIISNAIKYTNENGIVKIYSTTNSIIIEDNGIGIKKENIDKIWNRFYKESENRLYGSGFGLGLSITKKIIEDIHGFKIRVSSEEGVGSEFEIILEDFSWLNTLQSIKH